MTTPSEGVFELSSRSGVQKHFQKISTEIFRFFEKHLNNNLSWKKHSIFDDLEAPFLPMWRVNCCGSGRRDFRGSGDLPYNLSRDFGRRAVARWTASSAQGKECPARADHVAGLHPLTEEEQLQYVYYPLSSRRTMSMSYKSCRYEKLRK